jgi:hypothetical protein
MTTTTITFCFAAIAAAKLWKIGSGIRLLVLKPCGVSCGVTCGVEKLFADLHSILHGDLHGILHGNLHGNLRGGGKRVIVEKRGKEKIEVRFSPSDLLCK